MITAITTITGVAYEMTEIPIIPFGSQPGASVPIQSRSDDHFWLDSVYYNLSL